MKDADVAAIMGGIYGEGIIACKGAFTRDWVSQLGRDIALLFAEARQRPGGALAPAIFQPRRKR